jgi:hypothetical protein
MNNDIENQNININNEQNNETKNRKNQIRFNIFFVCLVLFKSYITHSPLKRYEMILVCINIFNLVLLIEN